MLGDYLTGVHHALTPQTRKNIIAYNPKKGGEISKKLIKGLPDFNFVPIAGMSASDVHALLSLVKIYMDFGHHPGKDRLPREAAIAGACVITGLRGAACNSIDIPILEKYKIDSEKTDFVNAFGYRAREIFSQFELASRDFDYYRLMIAGEREKFNIQCASLF